MPTPVWRLSEDGKIKSIKFNDYVSFGRGTKSANDESFKDFCNEAQEEQNCWNGGFYFAIFTSVTLNNHTHKLRLVWISGN